LTLAKDSQDFLALLTQPFAELLHLLQRSFRLHSSPRAGVSGEGNILRFTTVRRVNKGILGDTLLARALDAHLPIQPPQIFL
jgi:hypothetical protein